MRSGKQLPDDYRALRESAASVNDSRSVIRVEGGDTFDFLHRMSTNDLLTLGEGDARRTVIINEKGRIIDRVTVARVGGTALIFGSPGRADEITRWLGKFIIMEDVRFTGRQERLTLGAVYGPESPSLIGSIPEAGIFREDLGSIPGYVYVPDSALTEPGKPMVPPWEGSGIPFSDPVTLEMVRIEECVPFYGRELGPDVNALEAGLKSDISFSKGCYIGQEVIARLDTYRKLQNILTLFRLSDYDGETLSTGKIFHGTVEAGRINSTTWSPLHGAWIGLGYRKLRVSRQEFDFLPEGQERMLHCRYVPGVPRGYDEYEIQE